MQGSQGTFGGDDIYNGSEKVPLGCKVRKELLEEMCMYR
jgi:hypothetical protein